MPSIDGEIISSRVDKTEAESFKSLAKENGMTASKLVNKLVQAVNDGDIQVKNGIVTGSHEEYFTASQIDVLNEAVRKTHSGSVTEFLSGIVSQIERQL